MSRQEWPDAVGLTCQEAEKQIRQDYQNITIQVLPDGSRVTMDYNVDRVRIFVDGDGKVVAKPMIG